MSIVRTQEEIDRQIAGLSKEKQMLPEFSGLGTPNHAMADAQIDVLQNIKDADEFADDMPDEEDENFDDANEIHNAAISAEEWLDGHRTEDLFDSE